MINDMIGLKKYLAIKASKFATIASEIELRSPGCSVDSVSVLKDHLPMLSDSYLELIVSINVFGVSIGRFDLWPTPFGKSDLVSSLIEANTSEANPWVRFYNDNRVVEVARYEADVVCLGRKGSENDGWVYILNASIFPNVSLVKVASSFEQFLVVAGNLYDVATSFDEDGEGGALEFRKRLNSIGVECETFNVWEGWLEEELF